MDIAHLRAALARTPTVAALREAAGNAGAAPGEVTA
jgi:hypothetical protein